MILYIITRTEKSLLLPAPQYNAYGSFGLEVEGLDQPYGFHHHRAAGCIICGTGCCVPGIKVSAQHNQLVFQFWIGARNFCHDIITLDVLVKKFCFHVCFHFHGNARLYQALEPQKIITG